MIYVSLLILFGADFFLYLSFTPSESTILNFDLINIRYMWPQHLLCVSLEG